MPVFKKVSIVLSACSILLTGCSYHPGQRSPVTFNSNGYTYHGEKKEFPSTVAATGYDYFIFSPKKLAWGAYDQSGDLIGYGKASGGSSWCKDTGRACRTPTGEFRINRKGGYDCYSGKYPKPNGGAHMPYCMFFLNNYAIHGAPPSYVPNYNASHGCIRVTTSAAKWLRDNFLKVGTKVKVLSY